MKDETLSTPRKKSEKKESKKEGKGKPKHRRHIAIHEVEDGAFRADHTFHAHPDAEGPPPGPEEHNLPDLKSLQDHIGESYAPPQENPQGEAAGAGGGDMPAMPAGQGPQ
jgi:hypothetical protein